MHTKRRLNSVLAGLGLLASGVAVAAHASDATLAGWTPMVTLWGGEVKGAVKTLDEITTALNAAIHHYEIDAPTQKFINGVLEELKDFDLDGLYKLLPDKNGSGRELNVRGELSGNKYLVGRAEPGTPYFVSMVGPRSNLADMSLYVQAEQKKGGKNDSLFVGAKAGLGVGPLSYRAIVDAERELIRLVADGNTQAGAEPLPKSGLAREAVREMNPGLGEEDIDALALLFDAYPTLGRKLSEFGRIEDLLATNVKGEYSHITLKMRSEPKRFEKPYPNLAKHLKRLSDVLDAKARLLDDQGRDLVRVSVDSKTLQVTLECYVKDGLVLPFDDNQVYENEPLDPLGDQLKSPKVLINARINMLGIIITAKNLRADVEYKAHDSYASIKASVTTMPKLKVEGRALGLFAPGFLDIFIPGNIQSITEEFFRVVAKGNNGKGAHGQGDLGAKSVGAPGAISGEGSVEIMDTFLVKLAGGLVADRVMINAKAKDEAVKLAGDMLQAFKADLTTFKKRVGQ